MKSKPLTVRITFFFLWLIAAFWAVFAGLLILTAIPSIPNTGVIKWIMIVLALGCTGILFVMILMLKRHNRLAFFTTLVMLVIIAVLSITDEFGWPDLFSLLITLVPLVLMIKDRSWYLQPPEKRES